MALPATVSCIAFFDDAAAVGSAIDEIADEDDGMRAVDSILRDLREQFVELGFLAVNVADGVIDHAVRARRMVSQLNKARPIQITAKLAARSGVNASPKAMPVANCSVGARNCSNPNVVKLTRRRRRRRR